MQLRKVNAFHSSQFNSSEPEWQAACSAVPQQPQVQQRQAESAIGAVSDIDPRRCYPQAHPEDLSLAQAAIQTAVGRGIQRLSTAAEHLAALRRLANHLGAVGTRIAALDHDALVDYVKQFFASDRHMRFALPWLRHHRQPGAPPPVRRLLAS
ncbi:hypothetical protein ABIB90_008114 [Bradyrhizobium sp. JR4.1]|uniref:hypothetical protein n=1 Tax=unclassified Bradyrhizobium TaxID=2631580 RepID=UPI00055AE41E|nr:hypothetical protein [Bradyrhizobium sp. WSM1417]